VHPYRMGKVVDEGGIMRRRKKRKEKAMGHEPGDQEDLVPRDEEKENQGIESQSTTPLILPLECLSAEPTGKECTEDGDNMAL